MSKAKKLVKGRDYDGWCFKSSLTNRIITCSFKRDKRDVSLFPEVGFEGTVVRVKLVEVQP